MNPDVEDEIVSINAIYGSATFAPAAHNPSVFVLNVPDLEVSLRLSFPDTYPEHAPSVLGPESIGVDTRKGAGIEVVDLAQNFLNTTFQTGEPCLYDLVEYLKGVFKGHGESYPTGNQQSDRDAQGLHASKFSPASLGPDPGWVLSDVVTEKKSVFLARVAVVNTVDEAQAFVQHLLSSDKKAARATHNMTAWRIRDHSASSGVSYQDCDDDGENAAGGRLLHLLQIMDVWNVMVVVSRWYGGIHLGPDRFKIINSVARDALVKGGMDKAKNNGDIK